MNTNIILSVVVIIALILIFSSGKDSSNNSNSQIAQNVGMVDGKQIIEINAKGGYSPALTDAKANTPSILKFITKGTFDCSSSVTIPSIGYRSRLKPTGETDIEIPTQNSGAILRGFCSMGMYTFQIKFN